MVAHRLYVDEVPSDAGATLAVTGDEASHAVRAKRLTGGERIELLDGRGTVAEAVVAGVDHGRGKKGTAGCVIELVVERVRRVARTAPELDVWTATPKGGRVDEMIEGLSQAGAASWTPMLTDRGVVSPGTGKRARLERIAVGASKQCGRAWVLEVGEERRFDDAWEAGGSVTDGSPRLVLADASGAAYTPSGSARIRLAVGPEGGWSEPELRRAHRAGAVIARFGAHVMRIETAAVVAAGIILDSEGRLAAEG